MARLFKGVELLIRVAESGVFFVDYVRMGHFEEFVGGDAVEPLLLGYFLVAGEIEADEQLYGTGIGGLIVGFLGLFGLCGLGVFRVRFGLRGLLFFVLRLGFCRGFGLRGRFVAAIEFHLYFFVRAEGLLPSFEFVAGLLRFFVRELEGPGKCGAMSEVCGAPDGKSRKAAQGAIGKLQTRNIFWRPLNG